MDSIGILAGAWEAGRCRTAPVMRWPLDSHAGAWYLMRSSRRPVFRGIILTYCSYRDPSLSLRMTCGRREGYKDAAKDEENFICPILLKGHSTQD